MSRKLLALTSLLLTFIISVASAETVPLPNFTGIWIMNSEKSDFGPAPKPDNAQYAIRHQGANLAIVFTQDGTKKRMDFITDGTERVTESDEESEIWTRVYWSDRTLVFEARRKSRPAHETQPVNWISRWTLTEGGKELTINRRITLPRELNQTVVFEKR